MLAVADRADGGAANRRATSVERDIGIVRAGLAAAIAAGILGSNHRPGTGWLRHCELAVPSQRP
jgi:hypothetical protein